jgi:hypothetical protein
MSEQSVLDVAPEDRVIWRAELCDKLHVGSEALRRWIKAGKLPPPDVDLSQKTKGWRVSTLHAAGIRIV